ncbi:MAG: NERD domain-containing protein [Anaerolineales bacterium]|nr:NERD domain-containing protein [Anaerolineales bacterium]
MIIIVYELLAFQRKRRRYRALQLGLEGEKVVGQALEDLRADGRRVYHDLVGKNFNVDHVIVSPKGVFVIETKTYSKPARGETKVKFDGERILVNGVEPDRNPITQVRAEVNWVRKLLLESIGREFPMRGVVVLPGWYVEKNPKTPDGVWVLNPKALASFIQHEPTVLKPEDVALVATRLADYVEKADAQSK